VSSFIKILTTIGLSHLTKAWGLDGEATERLKLITKKRGSRVCTGLVCLSGGLL